LEPGESSYVVRHDEQQHTTVQFGMPLPTGQVNVRAVYRVGVGAGAAVPADALNLLAQRPPGISAGTNPVAAAGGADPETAGVARLRAPVRIRTLGRVVSLADYEDFAAAYPGIAKARAVRTRTQARGGVLVTIAGTRGKPVPETSDVYRGL